MSVRVSFLTTLADLETEIAAATLHEQLRVAQQHAEGVIDGYFLAGVVAEGLSHQAHAAIRKAAAKRFAELRRIQ